MTVNMLTMWITMDIAVGLPVNYIKPYNEKMICKM